MSQVKRTALVLGANGLIGEILVDILLKNTSYGTVYAVSRKGINKDNPKLIQILADMNNIAEKIKDIDVNDFFSCIGSTKSKTPDKEIYYKIDHDYPIQVANLLKNNGCQQVCLVSSIGANANSKNFYLELKGKTEQSMIDVGLSGTFIFQPSLIIGRRNERRTAELFMQKLSPLFNLFLFGSLKNFKSVPAEIIAKTMVNVALSGKKGLHIYKTAEIKELA